MKRSRGRADTSTVDVDEIERTKRTSEGRRVRVRYKNENSLTVQSRPIPSHAIQPHVRHRKFCFKDFGDPCDGSVAAANWTSLVDDLYLRSQEFIRQHPRYAGVLRFILDGGIPKPCHAPERWRPWIATFDSDSPQAALHSDDIRQGYDRFGVYNPSQTRFELDAAEDNFGKFANESSFSVSCSLGR